ncbi:MAG: hypothetical protein GXY85_03170 [Candidatus Brocadiaceae bacterium]|nr:hypothetical protein [Candidatus Brocadiaceae bacterium]
MTRIRRVVLWFLAVGLLAGASVRAAAPGGGPEYRFPRIGLANGVILHPGEGKDTYRTGKAVTLQELARYDLILTVRGPWSAEASWPVLREKLDRIRQANPRIVIIGPSVQAEVAHAEASTVPEGVRWHKPPDDAWLPDVAGRRLPGTAPGTFQLNLREQGVLEWLAGQCVEGVQGQGYDGVLLGGMGPAFPDWTLSRIAPGYTADADGDGIADDPADLRFLWQDAKRQLCADVRERLGHDAVIVAGGTPQTDFIYEDFNGWTTGTPLLELRRGNARWEYELQRYLLWTEAPHRPNTTMWISVPDSAAPPETEERALERMRFGLAATLMGDGCFAFVRKGREEPWFPEFDVPLGRALGPALACDSGAWKRAFEGGVAVVNPTAEAATFALETDHRDVSTGTVGREFTIPARDGRLLVPAG